MTPTWAYHVLGGLVVLVLVLAALLVNLERSVGYLEGRQSVYNEWAEDGTEGTHYTKGEFNAKNGKTVKRHQ